MSKGLDPLISAYERRRRAPLHFEARASNALHCARVLIEAGPLATSEGFAREASIALELIVKAAANPSLSIATSCATADALASATNKPARIGPPTLTSARRERITSIVYRGDAAS